MRTRLTAMGVAALAATLVLLLGGVFRHDRVAVASSALPAATVEQLQRGFATGDTAALVAGLQSELRARRRQRQGAGARSGSRTSSAHARPATPPTTAKAEGVLRRALGLRPRDLVATRGLADSSPCPPSLPRGARARPARPLDLAHHRRRVRRARRRASSSSDATARPSATSTGWRRSSPASRRTPASPTPVS